MEHGLKNEIMSEHDNAQKARVPAPILKIGTNYGIKTYRASCSQNKHVQKHMYNVM